LLEPEPFFAQSGARSYPPSIGVAGAVWVAMGRLGGHKKTINSNELSSKIPKKGPISVFNRVSSFFDRRPAPNSVV
jgi:hypothetical protein